MTLAILSGSLVALALAASAFDLRERRIPNALTVTAFGIALLLRAALGLEALGSGLAAAAIAFAVALAFFLVGGLGGGDLKLLTAVGAFVGLEKLGATLVAVALAGGVLAIVAMVRHRAFGRTAANLHALFATLGTETFTGWKGEDSEAALTIDTPGALTVPYGVAIAAGALIGWFA